VLLNVGTLVLKIFFTPTMNFSNSNSLRMSSDISLISVSCLIKRISSCDNIKVSTTFSRDNKIVSSILIK